MAEAKLCAVEGCGKKHSCKGLCKLHYNQMMRASPPFKACSIDGCQGNSHWSANGKKGWCDTHYMRWWRHGDTGLRLSAANGEPESWLLSHVKFDGDECLIWPYSTTKGYGKAYFNGSEEYAHRKMCEWVNGPAPSSEHEAAHSCGNGHLACVHPKHLRWATSSENSMDRHEHGTMLLGEERYNAVLTAEIVRRARDMRASGMKITAISSALGVSYEAIKQMLQGKSWSWLS